MHRFAEIVTKRLEGKGLGPVESRRFIRDVTNSISFDHDTGIRDVNIRLRVLGWDPVELDDHTFQLIKAGFEARERTG